MNLDKFGADWFDLVVVGFLVIGFISGRKRGMSNELLPLFQWLLMVVIPSLYYEIVGKKLMGVIPMPTLLAYLGVYIFLALVIKLAFTIIKRMVGEKLVGSDLFGNWEFYFGMVAGMLRWVCVTIMLISVVGATYLRPEDVEANKQKQIKEYGSTFFPSLGELQRDIVYKSIVGKFARKHLSNQMIEPTAYVESNKPLLKRLEPGKETEKAVNDILNGGKK